MPMVYFFYLALLFLSAAVTLALAVYLWERFWRRQRVQPARTFAFMMAAVSFWALGCALALHSGTPDQTYLWERIKYAGLLLVPPIWFLFSLQWTGKDRRWPRWASPALFAIPGLSFLMVMTDPWHHLIWTEFHFVRFGPFLFDRVVHGPVWWGLWTYSSILILLGAVHLIEALANLPRTYRVQAVMLMLGTLLPWMANLFFASGLSSLLVDVTPVFFILSCLIYIWGFSSFRMIDLVPVARDAVFSELGDPLFVLDLRRRVVDLNQAAAELAGEAESDLLGGCVWDMVLEPLGINRTGKGWNGIPEGVRIPGPEGERYFEIQIKPLRGTRGRAPGHILIFRDLTERRRAEDKIRDALKEKETLLQEIHHRVKNNMQLVVSLLRLQGSRISDPDLREVFATGESRIHSMAMIHEKLYMTRRFSDLDLKEFIQDLCRHLWRTYDPEGAASLVLELDDVRLGITQSIPCGLIIHELLSNALRHAFPKGECGEVRVSLCEKPENSIEFSVTDNGRGLPPDFAHGRTGSLGMTLVQELTDQLDGRLDFRNDSGACFRMTFNRVV